MSIALDNLEFILFGAFVVFSAILLGGFTTKSPQNPYDQSSIVVQTIMTPTPGPAQKTLQIGTFTVKTVTFLPGVHGAFNIETPQEADAAFARGVSYDIIDYWGNAGPGEQATTAAVDPTTPLGQELTKLHMKGFLETNDLLGYDSTGTKVIITDVTKLQNRVRQFYKSPLLAGYWVKDDDLSGDACNTGDTRTMTAASVQMYQIIRAIDTDLTHVIVPGFGSTCDLVKNYFLNKGEKMGDVLGLYPYPSYNGGLGAMETPAMLNVIKQRTPAGDLAPKWFGIYQDFASPNRGISISLSQMLKDVQANINFGAISEVGFGFEAGDVTQLAGNNQTLLDDIGEVSKLILANPLPTH